MGVLREGVEMEKEYLYTKKCELLKMFKNVNVGKREDTNLSKPSKIGNDTIKKTLIKSKYEKIKR